MADLVEARRLCKLLEAALADTPPVNGRAIATMDDLDRALATSPSGAVLTLSTSLVYNAPLVIRQSVNLISEQRIDGRMTKDAPAPKFLGGVNIVSDDVLLDGLDVRHTRADTDLVVISGKGVVLDHLRILGDPQKGAKRGIAANGTNMSITRCYIDDCYGPYPGSDTQAICGWDLVGLLIEDCYLSGGSETIMIGGDDPLSMARIPQQIIIRKNTITKNRAWMALPINVKNTLELKDAKDVLIEDNDISRSWSGHGQTGYLLMLTVRNQEGRAPFSTVQDVIVRNNRFSSGAAAINMLATDDYKEDKKDRPTPLGQVRPSVRMARVKIENNTFTDLDPIKYTAAAEPGSKRMILIQRGPQDVTIVDNTFQGQNLTSQVYFETLPKAERLNVSRNTWPKTTYGIFGSGASVGKAWDMYVTDGILSGNKEA